MNIRGYAVFLPLSWEMIIWGGTGATSNRLQLVGPWLGLAGNLGCLSNGERHNAHWGGLGIFVNGRLVAGRWCSQRRQSKRRQHQRQLISIPKYAL